MISFREVSKMLALAALGCCLLSGQASAQTTKKIVFIAAPKDHGVPGRHEYEKDLRVLAWCLEHASNVKGISTKVIVGRVASIDELKDADLIVIHGDGDRSARETNPLFPMNPPDKGAYSPETSAFLNDFGALMKKGVGLVIFHYTTEVDNETARQDLLVWAGGYYASVPGVRNNPVDQWS